MCVLSLLPAKLHGGTRFRARFITEEIQILGSSDHEGLGSLCRCRCTALLKLAVSNVDPSLSGIYLWQRRKHPLDAFLVLQRTCTATARRNAITRRVTSGDRSLWHSVMMPEHAAGHDEHEALREQH